MSASCIQRSFFTALSRVLTRCILENRLALKYHPDKQRAASSSSSSSAQQQAQDVSAKFQQIGFAYAVLSSESRRKRYDATGRTDESMFGDGEEMDWNAYFRELWTGEVNADTLESFRKKYRGA